MKRNSLAALLAAAALALNGCSPNNKRLPITKMKPGDGQAKGTSHADEKLTKFTKDECLNLKELAAALDQTGEAFLLYTYNLDLGTSSDKTRKDFSSINDDVLRGQAIKASSVKLATKGSKSLSDAATLDGLLAVKSQDACNSLVLVDSKGAEATWTVVDKAAGWLIVNNASTEETRKYSFTNKGEIHINLYTPTTKQSCAGQKLNLVRREAVTIAWDGRLNDGLELPVNFVAAVAKHVKLPPAFNVEPSKKDSSDDRVTVPQSVSVPQAQYELFKTIIEDGKFDGIDCKK